jgi:hypothetical protein
MPSGSGSPVSTQANAEAASRHTPAVSAEPAVSAALIAIPSIAAQADRGEGQRARTGAAVTRPSAAETGTGSVAVGTRHPAAVHASIHRA